MYICLRDLGSGPLSIVPYAEMNLLFVAVNLKIDGRTAANIVQGSRYDDFVPEGRHTLTVSAVPNYQPTSTVLNVQHGQTYVFTATRSNNADRVILVPSAPPPAQPH